MAAIESALEQLNESYAASDLETFVDSFTEDTVCLLPNRPPFIGNDTWRSVIRGMFESSTRTDGSLKSEEIVVAGDWAFEWHDDSALNTSNAGGEPRRGFNKGIFIFRRQTDGSWKIARYASNGSPVPEDA